MHHLYWRTKSCYKCIFIVLLFALGYQVSLSQTSHTWGIKIGLNLTNQVYEDIPKISIINVNGQLDTVFTDCGGNYNRTGISAIFYQEFAFSRRVSLLTGIGYRQRGFIGEAIYNRRSRWLEQMPEGQYNKNRFDNAFIEMAVKIGITRLKYLMPYLILGNRLDCRLGFKSDFWGDDYSYLSRLELSPVGGLGVEIPLKGVYLNNK